MKKGMAMAAMGAMAAGAAVAGSASAPPAPRAPQRADCPGKIICPLTGELVCIDQCPAGTKNVALPVAESPCCASK